MNENFTSHFETGLNQILQVLLRQRVLQQKESELKNPPFKREDSLILVYDTDYMVPSIIL